MLRIRYAILLASFVLLLPAPSWGRELWKSEDGSQSFNLDTALKGTLVITHAPDDPLLYPEENSSSSLWRGRIGLRLQPLEPLHIEFAYEHRTMLTSEGAGAAGLTFLPSSAEAPFRIRQLDWEIASSGDTYYYRHEIDRGSASYDLKLGERPGQITIGRHAIGMGRGVIFGAVDIFSPFSLLEVDREWRRGVDAARCDVPIGERSSLEIIGAFGETWEESGLIGHFQGISSASGNDIGIIGGKRGVDEMLGVSTSFRVGGAAVYLDAAAFRITDEAGYERLFGIDSYTAKAVAGASHKLGEDYPTLLLEYHYSGFGVKKIEDLPARLAEPAFTQRLLRGDMQIIGRHAFALQAMWEIAYSLSLDPALIVSPSDGSGLFQPTLRWDLSDNAIVIVSGILPFGQSSQNGIPKSEYGYSPRGFFLQLSVYD